MTTFAASAIVERRQAVRALLERATDARPFDRAVADKLAEACIEEGDREGALDALRRFVALVPNDHAAWGRLANLLITWNRGEEAVHAAQRAVELSRDDSFSLSTLGLAFSSIGEADRADEAFEAAFRLDPTNRHARRGRGGTLIRRAAYRELADFCEETMEVIGPTAWAIAQYSIALAMLGRNDDLARLINYETLVDEQFIEPPAEFATLDEFNFALREELYSLRRRPSGQICLDIIQGGWRIEGGPQTAVERLGREHAPACSALLECLLEQKERYEASLPPSLMRAIRPPRYRLNTEALVTSRQSSVSLHTHACTWLSMVYYVAVPPSVMASGHAGCMEFAPPTHKAPIPEGAWPRRLVRAAPGKLVRFPGYLYHHVYANEADEARIAITVDVHPSYYTEVGGTARGVWLNHLRQE